MTMLTKSLLTATAAFSLVACVKQEEAPSNLKTALPTAEQVRIKLPDGASRTVGQLADYYVITRNVTRTFNGGSASAHCSSPPEKRYYPDARLLSRAPLVTAHACHRRGQGKLSSRA